MLITAIASMTVVHDTAARRAERCPPADGRRGISFRWRHRAGHGGRLLARHLPVGRGGS